MLKKLLLYFHTLRHLKSRQIGYRILYFVKNRFSKSNNAVSNNDKLGITNSLKFQIFLCDSDSYFPAEKIMTFINLSYNFLDGVDWDFSGHGKLWNYNLRYFNYLNQENGISLEEGLKLINSFISFFDQSNSSYEPYPTSLRIINWIKFSAKHKIKDKEIDDSLYKQTMYLRHNLEFHLLGNHLLENAFALVFASYYFQDSSLFGYSKKLLVDELNEQILPDGAHFELSPMYHQTMLFRVLDTYNLVSNNDSFNRELIPILKSKAELMLGWLQQITFSNGDIPLVNDSAFGISPTTHELLEYGSRLGLHPKIVSLNESGYRKFNGDKFEMVADVGHIGPDYIPGHAHSDTFNFILYKEGSPFIVDTGTSTYNAGERRDIERQTSSHNTVKIGEYEQSETWSSFRVARRVKPVVLIDSLTHLSAKINYVTTDASHQRDFTFSEKEILISDKVDSKAKAESYIHFHPDVEFSIAGNIVKSGSSLLTFSGARSIESESFLYAPMFNILVASKRIVIEFEGQLDLSIVL